MSLNEKKAFFPSKEGSTVYVYVFNLLTKPFFDQQVENLIFLFSSLVFLMLASQRIETVIDFSGEPQTVDEVPTKRGAAPTLIEWTILSWVGGEF